MNNLNPIELAEKEIQRDKDDLKRLRKRYPGYDFIQVESKISPVSTRQMRTEMNELETVILTVVDASPNHEWTSRSILVALANYAKLPERPDVALNAIGAALVSLKEADKIYRAHEGRGRDPHRYISLLSDLFLKEEQVSKE